LKDTNELTTKVKDNPSLLLRRPRKKDYERAEEAVKDANKR